MNKITNVSRDSQPEAILVMTASGLIQRDALISAIKDSGIQVQTEERILSRKITELTPDLSYEGYSALADTGFPIFVSAQDHDRAKEIVENVLAAAKSEDQGQVPNYAGKFAICALFSFALPIFMHGLGAYHFSKALTHGQLQKPGKIFVLASALYLATLGGTFWFAATYFLGTSS
ncbi:MAG: hypothetical protein K2X47_12545 [Bdellovibrionales bacterium]|nr:hypothetical protein [Bdellovibrionales bacterium]